MKNLFTEIKNWVLTKTILKGIKFDGNLELDITKYISMNKKDREAYMEILIKKRSMAYELDIKTL